MFKLMPIVALAALAAAAPGRADPAAGASPASSDLFGISSIFDRIGDVGAVAKEAPDPASDSVKPSPRAAKKPDCARPDFGEPGTPGAQACPTPAPKPQ